MMATSRDVSAAPRVDSAPVAPTAERHATGLPFAAVLGCIAGICILATTQTPLRDIDLYWHLLAGRELVSGVPPESIGIDWTFGPDPGPWMSTQWLAEIALFRLHELGGWTAMAAIRVVTSAIVLAILALTTLRGRPVAVAGLPFTVAAATVCLWSQERPQQITYIGAAVLGGVIVDGLYRDRLPRWWLLLPGTALWANIHGGWVLAPVVLGMVAVGRVLDHGMGDRLARRALGLAALAAAAGAVSPAGLTNITATVRFSQAASDLIAEWQATTPMSWGGAFTVAMLVLAVIGWVRPAPVARSEVMSIIVFLLFAWAAWRNLAPGLLLMAPLVARRLCLAFPTVGLRPEPRWSAPLGVIIAATCTVIALAWLPAVEHLPTEEYPVGLAAQLDGLPGSQRVLNDYNVAGLVLYFGGEDVRVGIDGRTDRYGAQYIHDYRDALQMKGEWKSVLERLDPTAALIEEDSGLDEYLLWRGWQDEGRESGYVLLTKPESEAQ